MATDESNHETNREALMEAANVAAQKLLDTIDSASVADCMTKIDDAGWNSRDHLAHVTAWKRGAIFPLQGETCAAGMGVSPEQAGLPFDELNDLIKAQAQDQPMEIAVKKAIDTHKALEQTLLAADAGELERSNGEVIPELFRLDPEKPFVDSFRYCVVDHLYLHREYIATILSS